MYNTGTEQKLSILAMSIAPDILIVGSSSTVSRIKHGMPINFKSKTVKTSISF